MPTLCRWWLNRQWARDAHMDALARVDLTVIVFGVTLALLLR
jgi:hypothetical protein